MGLAGGDDRQAQVATLPGAILLVGWVLCDRDVQAREAARAGHLRALRRTTASGVRPGLLHILLRTPAAPVDAPHGVSHAPGTPHQGGLRRGDERDGPGSRPRQDHVCAASTFEF
eukprot:3734835-Prymnesium_polylepis.2